MVQDTAIAYFEVIRWRLGDLRLLELLKFCFYLVAIKLEVKTFISTLQKRGKHSSLPVRFSKALWPTE